MTFKAEKEPTVNVPASVFLMLVRGYKQLPQERVDRTAWLSADRLERRAYRKYLKWLKG